MDAMGDEYLDRFVEAGEPDELGELLYVVEREVSSAELRLELMRNELDHALEFGGCTKEFKLDVALAWVALDQAKQKRDRIVSRILPAERVLYNSIVSNYSPKENE